MNVNDLKFELDKAEINPSEYSLDGARKPMCTILSHRNFKWTVFDYDERGCIQGEKQLPGRITLVLIFVRKDDLFKRMA